MGLGYQRHVPTPLKGEMVFMHGLHQLPKRKVASLIGVHPSTVRRTLNNAYTTGSVVKKPLRAKVDVK